MKPFIIAEIGCNHKGDIEIAKKMITVLAEYCKVDAVKFQKRNNRELLSEEEYNKPHPNPNNAYGKTYGEHRDFLEFSIKEHAILKSFCEEKKIIYSSSVWDMTSAREIASLNPKFIKIPSAENINKGLVQWICDNYQGEIHISTGMTTKEELDRLVEFLKVKDRAKDTILYSCTSGYPVPTEDVCLLEIAYLKEKYGKIVKGIGFSGHHNGVTLDMGAYTLGANYIERHFTLDRTWKGTDHAASLEPDGMYKLVRRIHSLNVALKYKEEDILKIEGSQRKKLKYKGDNII
ncbi:MAG: N-acetylneuraminate synthase [Clostridia bacterium]|nr:N-acetylneuraminate synthase [Clostridia bacterium]